jgi:hypothetical protein
MRFLRGGATAQAVNRRLPTAAARVPSQVEFYVGFVVDEVALGQVSSEYVGFPCQFSCSALIIIYHPGLVQ